MATKTQKQSNAERYPYTPESWSPEQAQMHIANDLDEAFNLASCLSGGWYCRPVAIDFQVTEDNTERYMLRPYEVEAFDGWTPLYEVKRL